MTKRSAGSIVLTILLLVGGAKASEAQKATITPTPRQTVLNNAGQFVAGACIWTYVAGTTTLATTYTDQTAATPNADPIIADSAGRFVAYLSPGNAYKFQYELTPCSSGSHGTILFTQDNIEAVNAAGQNTAIIGTAGQTLNAATCAYLSDGSGGKTAGQFYPCDSANVYSSTLPTIGMVPSQIASGSTGVIVTDGYITGLSSLVVGTTYVVGTAGAITAALPSNARRVGQADTATSLVISANPPNDLANWTTFTSTLTGWSVPVQNVYTRRTGTRVDVQFSITGTSNATTTTFSLPYAVNSNNPGIAIPVVAVDNGAAVTGQCILALGSVTVTCYTTYLTGAWTASGTKTVQGQLFYQP